jgi:MFS family permease
MMPALDISNRKRERWITAWFFILAGFLSASWSSRIPDIQKQLNLNNAALGTVLFALPAGFIAGITVAGWLAVKYGTRTVVIFGNVLGSLLLITLGYAQTPLQLMMALFLAGFVRTVFNISINTKSIEVQKLYDRPIVSMFHGLWSLACFGAAGIGAFMIVKHISPGTHFTIIGFCSLGLTVILSFFFKKNEKAPIDKRPLFVKPDRFLFLLGLIAFCVMLCESTVFDWSVNYFEKVVRVQKEYVTAGYTAFIITMATGRLAGDYFIKRFGALAMMRFNGSLIVAGFMLAVAFPYLITATLGLLLIGLGDSIMVPLAFNLSSRSTKMRPSYAIAAVTMIGYIGFLLGPVLVGFISESLGMRWAFATVGAVCLSILYISNELKPYITKSVT